MPVDFSAQLYDPVYEVLGVPAVLTVAGSDGAEVEITVIDDTRPKVLPISTGAQAADVRGTGPGAFARVPELAENGITRADYADAALVFNGLAWIVRSWELIGSPNGEDFGEVRFALKADAIG